MRHLFLLSFTKDKSARGFTLVELLVSMAVLVLLVVLIAQLVNSATVTTTGSRKHMDADSQARLVFDRMGNDFAKIVKRPDVDYIFSKQGSAGSSANDTMFFYSEAPAYYSNSSDSNGTRKSSAALVGYTVQTTGSSAYKLQRLGKLLSWGDSGSAPGSMVFLTFATNGTTPIAGSTMEGLWSGNIGKSTDTPPYSNGVDTAYHILGDSVFRLEFCFQVKDLTNPAAPGAAYSNYPVAYFNSASNQSTISSNPPGSPKAGDRWYDSANNRAFFCASVTNNFPSWQPLGMGDVLGVVVALAILDNGSQQVVLQSNVIPASIGDKMVAAFADPKDSDLTSATPTLMAATWQNVLKTPGFGATMGLPPTAASQVRIYQRLFSLNTP